MTTTTIERSIWICENCRNRNHAPRKRCTDCGTSRH
jgi:hypothetical protein